MATPELPEYTRISKYAAFLPEANRRENWTEQIGRKFGMHREFYGERLAGVEDLIVHAEQAMIDKRALGSQRVLQFGGSPILKHHARVYNCTVSFADRLRFFQEAFYLLLCGCGTGFSVQEHHVARLPRLWRPRHVRERVFTIPDTIEGWADALGVLLSSWFDGDGVPFPEYQGCRVLFDPSQVRPKGAPISSGSKAPGPEPLMRALDNVNRLMERCFGNGKLRPIDAYDTAMYSSDAVLAGGVRRSASIAMFSPTDMDMVMAKAHHGWWDTEPQRKRSNNSAVLLRGETTREEFAALVEMTKRYGEPGFVWTDSTELVVNPCVPGDEIVLTSEGPKTVEELVGRPFHAIVNGQAWPTTAKGFFATGHKEVFEVRTAEGHQVRATANHRFMTQRGWVEVGDLAPGDKMTLHRHENVEWSGAGTFGEGWLLGSFMGDGTVSREVACLDYWGAAAGAMLDTAMGYMTEAGLDTYKEKSGCWSSTPAGVPKVRVESRPLWRLADEWDMFSAVDRNKIPDRALDSGSSDFARGFLRGWFDADGTVGGDRRKGCSVRLCSTDLVGLRYAQAALLRLGVVTTVYQDRYPAGLRKLPDGQGGMAYFECAATHDLVISRSSMQVFADRVGFHDPEKSARLADMLSGFQRPLYASRFEATFVEAISLGVEEVYDCTVLGPHAFDCSGFYAHNCVEIGMWPVWVDEAGVEHSGWQMCNLSTINGAKCTTPEAFWQACEAAAVMGTLQAGYTSFPYLGEISEKIVQREALLGVSITGMMEQPEVLFDPETLANGAALVKSTNAVMAHAIGINPAARATCLKPEGTSSCMLDTCSGIHPYKSRRGVRHVQANTIEPPYQHFARYNPHAVYPLPEHDPNRDNTVVLAFPYEVPEHALTQDEVTALDLLEKVVLVRRHWVETGTREELCVQPWLRHNVSNTVHVQDHEWDQVIDFIYENRGFFAGVALLSAVGDKVYEQAPFMSVLTPDEQAERYGAGAVEVARSLLEALPEAGFDSLWAACHAAEHTTFHDLTKSQRAWAALLVVFADNWFSRDLMQAGFCIKDVYAWDLWTHLSQGFQPVDWSTMYETEDVVDHQQAPACAGGHCDVPWL